VPAKMARLAQWCDDATQASHAEGGPDYRFVYVDEDEFGHPEPSHLTGKGSK